MAIRIIGGITLPSEEEVKNSIVFKTYGTKCEPTDYAVIKSDENGKGHCASWVLKEMIKSFDPNGKIYNRHARNEDHFGIRPVIHFEDMSDIIPYIVRENNGIPEAEICEIEQFVVNNKTRRKLDKELANDNLKEHWEYTKKVYIYNGEKYIRERVESRINNEPKHISGLRTVKSGDNVWIKISPIVWYVDEKLGILISKYEIDNVFNHYRNLFPWEYDGIFENTEIYNYLNKDLLLSISQGKDKKAFIEVKHDDILETNPKTIPEIIDMIKKILNSFPKDNQVLTKVHNIVDENNKEIEEIANKNRKNEINLNLKTPEMINKDTVAKLTYIYNNLKENYKSIKVYNDMLSVINNSKKVLNGIQSKKDETEVYKLFSDIGTVILPFLDKTQNEEIKDKLLSVLNEYETEIKNYLENLTIDNQEENKPKNNSVEDLEMSIRLDIHPILLRLGFYVERKDLLSVINKSVKENIRDNFKQGKFSQIKMYLTYINEVVSRINQNINRNPGEYQFYKEQLSKLINFQIDLDMNIEEINNILFRTCKDISGLEDSLNGELKAKEFLIDEKKL